MTSVNLYNTKDKVDDNQLFYDSFNRFVFDKDRSVFNKLVSKFMFYDMTKNLNGDIVECGVFKGSGMMAWLKLLDLYEPNSLKKCIGFDFFGDDFVDELHNDIDRETMRQVFTRDKNLKDDDVSMEGIRDKILRSGIRESKFELVKGDIGVTSAQAAKERPGFRISVLNLDLDLDEPTYATLVNLWDRVVPGGVVVFDEYAYHRWSESNAVDRFVRLKGLELRATKIQAPTAFIVKP